MAEYKDREHFIPLRKTDLVDLLCSDKDFPRQDLDAFRRFCRLVSATYHFEYHRRLEELKDAYAPFDPDADTRPLVKLTSEQKQGRLDDLFKEFAWLMERANFQHLTMDTVRAALEGASDWGINMDVDFNVFERLEIFSRGDVQIKRSRRRWQSLYFKEEIKVPSYQRLVLILKLKPHKRLGRAIDSDSVYLKVFKDIPKLDLEMLLPGARVHLTKVDRSKIGLPFVSGLAVALWNILDHITSILSKIVLAPAGYLWAIATAGLGYSYKSWYGYLQTKQHYSLTLTESLYYQNLDNNAGVLFRLLDEAEEQEFREAVLAYYFLWRYAGDKGWTSGDLDDYVELYLERYANLKVDFEIGDAIAKLERARIVEKVGDRYRAPPLATALEMLGGTWDNYFGMPRKQSAGRSEADARLERSV
jgi:hypothetical protein